MQILYIKIDKAIETEIKQLYGEKDMMVGYQQAGRYLTSEQVELITDLRGVKKASTLLIPYFGNGSTGIYYLGVPTDELVDSTYKIHSSLLKKPGSVIISKYLAERFSARVGDRVNIPFPSGKNTSFEVVQILTDYNSGTGGLAVLNYLSYKK